MKKHLRLLLIAGLLILLNLIGSAYFMRFDLTKEKRYSLSGVSKEMARKLSSIQEGAAPVPLYLTVYLEGEFSPNIRRFQDAIRATLNELRLYSRGFLEYEFVDPSNQRELLKQFQQRGLLPIPVRVQSSATEITQKAMYPYALARYRDRELYIDLLKGCAYPNGGVNFAKAEADLEYKLVSAIKTLYREEGGLVAILQGHGEPALFDAQKRPNRELAPLINELENGGYNIAIFDRAVQPGLAIPPNVSVLLILQPEKRFSERDKYEIDQYLMRGGSVFWIMDQQEVKLELYRNQATLTRLRELNLDDMFMKYGFKLNYDLIQDLSCEKTEVFQETASGGQINSLAWPFYPLVLDLPDHPVTRNVDAVLLRYASSIDTLQREGIQKSVFLTTSPRSRTLPGVQHIDLGVYLKTPPPATLYNKGPQITGLMLEGIFSSLFDGRQIPTDSLSPELPTAAFGRQNNPAAPGKMAIISDGEFFLGKKFRGERGLLPHDNATLILNVIDYLAGDNTLTEIRSKDVVIRNLDREKVTHYLTAIRLVNLLLPILFIAAFGSLRHYWRKRKHQRLRLPE
ncbi:MAG: hypothetical protein D6730_25380 [Bacteroidetes bacterium]|nr:MAG: hypothetical protein D6730_25380 [Bacteroidota bacterium]